jgi:hypothetical protein
MSVMDQIEELSQEELEDTFWRIDEDDNSNRAVYLPTEDYIYNTLCPQIRSEWTDGQESQRENVNPFAFIKAILGEKEPIGEKPYAGVYINVPVPTPTALSNSDFDGDVDGLLKEGDEYKDYL